MKQGSADGRFVASFVSPLAKIEGAPYLVIAVLPLETDLRVRSAVTRS